MNEKRSGYACPSCYMDTAQPPREFCNRRDLHEVEEPQQPVSTTRIARDESAAPKSHSHFGPAETPASVEQAEDELRLQIVRWAQNHAVWGEVKAAIDAFAASLLADPRQQTAPIGAVSESKSDVFGGE